MQALNISEAECEEILLAAGYCQRTSRLEVAPAVAKEQLRKASCILPAD